MATRFHMFTGADATGRDEVVRQANEAIGEIEARGGGYMASHWSATGYGGGGGGSHVHYVLVLVSDDGQARAGDGDGQFEDGNGFDYGDGDNQ